MHAYNRFIKYKSKHDKINMDGVKLILKKKGVYLTVSDLTQSKIKMVKKAFTIKIPSGVPSFPPQNKTLYINADKRKSLVLPRFGVHEKLTNFTLVNNIKDTPVHEFKWNGTLKKNQRLIHDHIIANVFNEDKRNKGNAGCILKLGAGLGKSFIALSLIVSLGRKCLLVTHSTNMVFQWAELIEKWAPSIKIGYCYGRCKKDGDIIISIINTVSGDNLKLGKKVYTKTEFFNLFGFIVCDESQLMLSESAERLYRRCQSTFMIGLSATPEENTKNKDCIAWWNLGPVLDAESIDGYLKSDVKFTGEVKMIKYLGPHKFTKLIMNDKLGIVSIVKMIGQMMEDPYRIHIIAKETLKLQKANHNVFIFADRRKYLNDIKDHMIKLGIACNVLDETYKPNMVKRLVGGCSPEEMKAAEEQAQVILTTYQYMSVGKSIPKMNAIILASPRKNYNEQTIKRIFRLGSDTSIKRKIIDVVDWKTPMKSQWYERKKYFTGQEYPIDMVRYEWTDLAKEVITIQKHITIPKNMLDEEKPKKKIPKKKTPKKKTTKPKKKIAKKKVEPIKYECDDISESEEPSLNERAAAIFDELGF